MPLNICALCHGEFDTEEQYCDHQCVETGFTPQEPAHFGDRYEEISQAAQDRGEERAEEEA